MKLYLVYRTDRVDYDEHDSFVVAANSEENALNFSPYGDNNYSTWTKYKEDIKIECIGESNSKVEKIILASYNAS